MIVDLLNEAVAKRRKISPCHTNRASQLGHACERFLVLLRTDWEKQQLYSTDLQARFDIGNLFERDILKQMLECGLDIIDLQRSFFDKTHNISGHIDGKIELDTGEQIPFEIKSMATQIFNQINSLADFQKYSWTRKYIVQLQLYLYFTAKELGIFVLASLDGRKKEIEMEIDIDFIDGLLKKADRINKHVAEKTLPDYINDYAECKGCSLFGHCQPPMDFGPGAQIIDDEELIDLLEIREETKESQKQYNRAHDRIREYIGTRELVLAGNFKIDFPNKKNSRIKIQKLGE